MNERKSFTPFIIQIGNAKEVLYINYSSDIDASFQKFLRRHSRLRNSVLRADLFDRSAGFKSSKQANQACLELIKKLEKEEYEFIAGGPLLHNYWQTYVIEIEGNPKHVYVGETNYPVEKRFQQHIYRFNPARALLRYNNFELAMHHATHMPKLYTKEESLRAETTLAKDLRQKGYKVDGGH